MKRGSDGSVMISDLSTARPETALADEPKHGCWYAMDYELEDGTQGVMLTADPHFEAAEIEIPLNVSGVYKIYIGVNYAMQCYEAGRSLAQKGYGSLWMKLTGERGYSRIGAEKYSAKIQGMFPRRMLGDEVKGSDCRVSYTAIYETHWKMADLTGKNLMVSVPKPPYNNEFYRSLSNITFIRLEPATAEDLKFMNNLKPRAETKNMAVIWCAGALTGHTRGHYMYHPRNSQWFEDDFQAYRDSDYGIFCMEAIRGNLCLFKTKHGDVGTLDKSWGEDWADPLAEFTRLAHDAGMKMFVSIRLAGGGRTSAFNPINWARFFWDNLQWAKKDKEGNLCSNVSLAYEGARGHWLALLREALDYGIDGIVLYFNRSAPYVMYEEPSVTSFMEKYGIDPRELPEDDERWQEHVAGYVTQFVREVRNLLDEKPGRELSIIYSKSGNDLGPGTIDKGCDPDTWMKEGLVDYLFFDQSITAEYIAYCKELGKGRVKVYSSLMPRQQPGEEFTKLAESIYEKGFDGFFVWDCERRIQRASEWDIEKHLGHRDQLKAMAQRAPGYFRTHQIKLLRGLNVLYSYKDG